MKFQKIIVLIISSLWIISCGSSSETNIKTGNLNYEIAISRNIEDLQNSNDVFSMHIDSILSGLIDSELISTGIISFDLNEDNVDDIGFEIIDLLLLNGNDLPEELDSLAVRVISDQVDIIDNSTYGYADALDENYSINESDVWSVDRSTLVLGTFANAGNFNGKGWKYLGFRFNDMDEIKYGWINVYVSEKNDTIKIGDYGYNDFPNSEIMTGQIE